MALSSVLKTASSGLKVASVRVDSAANNIVNINTDGYEASTVQQQTVRSGGNNLGGGTAVSAQLIGSGLAPDLGQELTRLIEAEATYKANAKLFSTASELSRETLNAIA